MDEMCGRSVCGVDLISALMGLGALWTIASLLWDKVTGKAQSAPEKPTPPRMSEAEEAAAKDFGRRYYEATKLIYADCSYVRIFDRYPAELKKRHLTKVAGYVDEIAAIDKFVQQLMAMPPNQRAPFEEETEVKLRRKADLLLQTYVALEQDLELSPSGSHRA